jgi:LMBR1 domain-containing protein 1
MFLFVSSLVWFMLLIAWAVVRYYSDPKYSHPLANLTTLFALLCSLACVLIIPLDVLSVVNPLAHTDTTAVATDAATKSPSWFSFAAFAPNIHPHAIHTTYHALFLIIGIIVFVLIPFSYFYVEDDEETTETSRGVLGTMQAALRKKGWFARASSAMRNTLIVCVIMITLLCILLYFKPITTVLSHAAHDGLHKDAEPATGPIHRLLFGAKSAPVTAISAPPPATAAERLQQDPRVQRLAAWAAVVADEYNSHLIDRLLTLAIGVFSALGLCSMLLYTSYGLFALPIRLMRSSDVSDAVISTEYDLVEVQQRKQVLQSKLADATVTGKLRTKLAEELAELQLGAKRAHRRRERLQSLSEDWVHRIYVIIHPIRALLGAGLLAVSAGVVLSLAGALADMGLHSICGLKCGFIVDKPAKNPLDWVLVWLSARFPLDFVAMTSLAFYLFFVTMYGMLRLGIRLGPMKLFDIRAHKTWPQALLLLCVSLLCSLLGLMVAFTVIAPQYAAFGSQTHQVTDAHGTRSVPCSQAFAVGHSTGHGSLIEAPCTATQVSQFAHRLIVTYPIFSLVFYVLEWCFVIVSTVIGLRLGCKNDSGEVGDDDDFASDSEDEDEKLDIQIYKNAKDLERMERKALLR